MSSHQQPSSFDEPSLKAALRGSARPHSASASLRSRIAGAMSAASVPDASIPLVRKTPSPIGRLIRMAALIAVTVGAAGIGYWLYMDYGPRRQVGGGNYDYQYATNLWTVMAQMHTAPDASCTTQPITPLTSPLEVATAAGRRLGWKVPAPRFQDATLDAASYVTIAGHPAVRFHFAGKGESFTVVSLPEAAWTDRNDATDYARVVDGQPIAGYVRDGGLHCIVGDKDASPQRIQALVDQLRVQ